MTKKNEANAITTIENEPTGKAMILPNDSDTFEDMIGVGLENISSKDIAIPRISLLQGLSPQLIKSKPEYIQGAAIGQFADSMRKESFDQFNFIPVSYQKNWLEWAPRQTAKGLIAIHSNDTILKKCTQNERRQWVTSDGNLVQETASYYALNLSTASGATRCFFSLASTQLKASRQLLLRITGEKVTRKDGSMFTPPLFYRAYSASSGEMSNADGTWNVWQFQPGPTILELDPSKSLLNEAKDYHALIASGSLQEAVAAAAAEAASEGQSNSGTSAM